MPETYYLGMVFITRRTGEVMDSVRSRAVRDRQCRSAAEKHVVFVCVETCPLCHMTFLTMRISWITMNNNNQKIIRYMQVQRWKHTHCIKMLDSTKRHQGPPELPIRDPESWSAGIPMLKGRRINIRCGASSLESNLPVIDVWLDELERNSNLL